MIEAEAELKRLYSEFNNYCASVKQLELKDLTDVETHEKLRTLKEYYTNYNDYYGENFDKLPVYKQILYSRQKSTVHNNCVEVVEFLKFEFETDFIYAAALDESFKSTVDDSSSQDSKQLERTLSVPVDLNNTIIDNFDSTIVERNSSLPRLSSLTNVSPGTIMSEFDIKLANSLIPDFDGSPKDVHDFLNKVEFYNTQLNDAGKTTLLDFVLKIKLKAKIADQVRLPARSNNFEGLKGALLARYSDKTNKSAKINQMERLYQNDTVANFASKLENLCSDLIRLKMVGKDETVRQVIVDEVDELAIKIFVRGLRRPEVKQALIYKEPTSLADAVRFALEADAKFFEPQQSNVNAYTHSSNGYGRGFRGNKRGRNGGGRQGRRGRSNFRGNNRNGQNSQYDSSQNNRQNNGHNSQQFNDQNYTSYDNQNNSRQNRNSNNNQRGRYHNNNQGYNNNYQNNRGNSSVNRSQTFNNDNNTRYVNQLQQQGNEVVPQQVDQPTQRLGDLTQQ